MFSKATAPAYCGADTAVPRTALFAPRQATWDLNEQLTTLTDASIGKFTEAFSRTVWDDMRSERDAENLCLELQRRTYPFTAEFQAFEATWRVDEWKHYVCFRRICARMFGATERAIDQELNQPGDFSLLERYMADEFAILLMIAWDELNTVRGYANDRASYLALGKEFSDWFDLVRIDEGNHYANAVGVLKMNHRHRFDEAHSLVASMMEMDLAGHNYLDLRTFVANRTDPVYTPKFLAASRDILTKALA